jgi:hypothetical protein
MLFARLNSLKLAVMLLPQETGRAPAQDTAAVLASLFWHGSRLCVQLPLVHTDQHRPAMLDKLKSLLPSK